MTWDLSIKINATIIKLFDKRTTFMEIIDYVNISYYPIYHIFEISPTFFHSVYLSHYQSIQETKYKDHGDKSSKSEYYLVCITIYQVSHQRLLTIMNKPYVYSRSNEISQNNQICAQKMRKK